MEAFNLFNHTNLGTPERYVNTPQFGSVIMAATPARQVQFAGRLTFGRRIKRTGVDACRQCQSSAPPFPLFPHSRIPTQCRRTTSIVMSSNCGVLATNVSIALKTRSMTTSVG